MSDPDTLETRVDRAPLEGRLHMEPRVNPMPKEFHQNTLFVIYQRKDRKLKKKGEDIVCQEHSRISSMCISNLSQPNFLPWIRLSALATFSTLVRYWIEEQRLDSCFKILHPSPADVGISAEATKVISDVCPEANGNGL